MSIDESVTAGDGNSPHGFTIDKRRRWPYLIVAPVVVIAVAAFVVIQRSTGYAESFLAAGVSEDKLIFAPKSPDQFADGWLRRGQAQERIRDTGPPNSLPRAEHRRTDTRPNIRHSCGSCVQS